MAAPIGSIPAERVGFKDGTSLPNKLDLAVQGLSSKASVRVATTGNIILSGTQTIDGVTVAVGDRVLVKNQTATADNGIRVVNSGSWPRATDMDTWSEVPGAFVFVSAGTTNASTGWTTSAASGGTIGTTAMPWVQFSGAGTYTAGNGLSLNGGQFSLAAPVTVANGGTGATSASAARTNLGLGNVDNTSDVNKPVSTAQAAADALRVLKAGDTMTGALSVPSFIVQSGLDLTIANDTITPTGAFHRVSTEGGATTDDLVTINATGLPVGFMLTLASSSGATTIRSTGNIALFGSDFLLNGNATIELRWNGAAWAERWRNRRVGGVTRLTADAGMTLTGGNSSEFIYLEGARAATRIYSLATSLVSPGDAVEFYNATTGGFSHTIRNLATATNIATLPPGKAFRARLVDNTIGFVPLFQTP